MLFHPQESTLAHENNLSREHLFEHDQTQTSASTLLTAIVTSMTTEIPERKLARSSQQSDRANLLLYIKNNGGSSAGFIDTAFKPEQKVLFEPCTTKGVAWLYNLLTQRIEEAPKANAEASTTFLDPTKFVTTNLIVRQDKLGYAIERAPRGAGYIQPRNFSLIGTIK